MKVAVIGTGYVGLTTGVSLAYLGHEVICVDVDVQKVNLLLEGNLPFFEPELGELLEQARHRITFTSSYREAVSHAELIFVTVGTPANSDGSPNLTYLFSAVGEALQYLQTKSASTVIVNKSTVPVGTADLLQEMIQDAGLESKVTVASNPEFLRQGLAVRDTLYPDRIVVGGTERAVHALKQLYAAILDQSFTAPGDSPRPAGFAPVPFVSVDRRSAELAKYAANAFLAMKISFINEIANVCDRVGANVSQVAGILGMDPRIGAAFLKAGIGYGGSCFPKDTRALQHIADTNGYDFKLLSAVIEVNNAQKFKVIEKLEHELIQLRGAKVAVLGLTFKPNTDDLREAPSLPIIEALLQRGAEVYVHDPVAIEKARLLLPSAVHFTHELTDAIRDAEAAILITEWPEYIRLDAGLANKLMRRPLFVDGRNALGEDARSQLEYRGIGLANKANLSNEVQVNV